MRTENDVLEVTRMMAADLGCTMADVAAAVERQQSALCRQLSQNPTWRTLMDVAWALGLGINPETGEGRVAVQWLLISKHDYKHYRGTYFVLNHSCQVLKQKAVRENRKLTRHATWGRGPDYDPTDRSHLSQVYPAKALEGVDGAPLDSRFIEPEAPQPLHGKTTQGPGGAARLSTEQYESTAAHVAVHEQAVNKWLDDHTPEQRQARLSEGAPQGYRLSTKALADAPRSTFALWQKAGWDIDKLIHHGYLEVDPANPPAYEDPQCKTCGGHGLIGGPSYAQPDEGGEPCPDCNYPPQLATNPIEARRLQASQGCPDGWILSDKALEVSDDVTYDKLARAMDVDQLKEQKYMVPRAWLGYD